MLQILIVYNRVFYEGWQYKLYVIVYFTNVANTKRMYSGILRRLSILIVCNRVFTNVANTNCMYLYVCRYLQQVIEVPLY